MTATPGRNVCLQYKWARTEESLVSPLRFNFMLTFGYQYK